MNKFKVNISGMTCTGCEKHVESALEKIGAKILSLVIIVVKQYLNCPMILRLKVQ